MGNQQTGRRKERAKEPESVFFSRCSVSQLREGENSNIRHFRRAGVSEWHTRRHLKEGDGREEEEQEKSRRRREKGLCTSSDDWRHRSVKKEKNKPFLKHWTVHDSEKRKTGFGFSSPRQDAPRRMHVQCDIGDKDRLEPISLPLSLVLFWMPSERREWYLYFGAVKFRQNPKKLSTKTKGPKLVL